VKVVEEDVPVRQTRLTKGAVQALESAVMVALPVSTPVISAQSE